MNIKKLVTNNSANNESNFIKVVGTVKRTIFQSKQEDEFGKKYSIFLFNVDDVVSGSPIYNQGTLCISCTGDVMYDEHDKFPYTVTANMVNNEKYGIQYQVTSMSQQIDFSQFYNQKQFLSFLLSKPQVDALFDKYEDPISLLENKDIEALTSVKGIKLKTATRILEKYESAKNNSTLFYRLIDNGFTDNLANKIIKYYGEDMWVFDMIKENPYKLIGHVDGIGFKIADSIAANFGITGIDKRRMTAYVRYFLQSQAEDNGNSYVTLTYFQDCIKKNFEEFDPDDVIDVLDNVVYEMTDTHEVVVEDIENIKRIYLKSIYELERKISNEIKRLMSVQGRPYNSLCEQHIRDYERKENFKFSPEQIDGIKLGLSNQVCLICGLAGTGKSSLVKGILEAAPDLSFAQCALAGKAAARLQEVTHHQGQTIHRLLGYQGGETGTFQKNETNQIDTDIVIVDEISLVGGELFLSLLKAIKTGTKLIMLGDLGQLESIGKLNIAHDIYTSKLVPTVELKTIYRQAAESGIITAAHKVRNQEQLFSSTFDSDEAGLIVEGKLQDMKLAVFKDRKKILKATMGCFMKMYNSEFVNKDINNIQAISPLRNRGDCSVYQLNKNIQARVNPLKPNEDAYYFSNVDQNSSGITNDNYIHANDKVMCEKNMYGTYNENGEKVDIFNGWVGTVTKVDITDPGFLHIYFPLLKDVAVIPFREAVNCISLGYASTVHKLQGSDVPVVVGVIDYATPPLMLTNSLLYTLITRAKKRCFVICENGAVRKAISTNKVSEKHTFLKELLDN